MQIVLIRFVYHEPIISILQRPSAFYIRNKRLAIKQFVSTVRRVSRLGLDIYIYNLMLFGHHRRGRCNASVRILNASDTCMNGARLAWCCFVGRRWNVCLFVSYFSI